MHNTPEPFTQAETFGWVEAGLWIFAALVVAATVYANLPLILWALGGIL